MNRLSILLILILLSAPSHAQAPTVTSAPSVAPRTTHATSPEAPSILQGRVVIAQTGKPLNKARIHLNRVGNSASGINREALTNRDGLYRFENVPPGRYYIQASAAGYLDMRAGQKRPDSPADLWEVFPSQVQQLDFALPRGAVIAGRISDDSGEPLAGAAVTPLLVEHTMSGTRLRPPYAALGSNRTDDRGQFRISGLRPGTYVVAARVETDAIGDGYATTYYPGTRSLSEARQFVISGAEDFAASFSVIGAKLVSVSGQVRSSTGDLVKNYAAVLATENDIGSVESQITNTGNFEFRGVAPGRYRLEVSTSTNQTAERTTPAEFAIVPLEVGEEDISGLQISTGHGVMLSGRVVFDGTPPAIQPSHKPRVYATFLDQSKMMWRPRNDDNNGVIAADGTFSVRGTYGRVMLWIDLPGWQVESVMLDGVDITEFPYDTSRGGTDRFEITVTDQKQSLQGRVVGPFGKPAAEFVVIVFPGGARAGGLRATRYVPKSTTQNSDGTFNVPYLRPGDYFAVALTSAPASASYDLDFLETLKSRATPFQLSPGETARIELTLIE